MTMHRQALSIRLAWVILMLVTACLIPASSKGATGDITVDLDRAMFETLTQQIQTLEPGSMFTVQEYPLPDGSQKNVVFQAFPLWAPDASIMSITPSGERPAFEGPLESGNRLLGTVEGEPTGVVQIHASSDGLRGEVNLNGQSYEQIFIDSEGEVTLTFRPQAERPWQPLEEELQKFLLQDEQFDPAWESWTYLPAFAGGSFLGRRAFYRDEVMVVDLAIVTDDEMFQRFGPNLDDIRALVEATIDGINVIYYRDVRVVFRLTWLGMYIDWPGLPDPFSASTSLGVLLQFQADWNAHRTHVIRDVAMLITGRQDLDGSRALSPDGEPGTITLCDVNWAYVYFFFTTFPPAFQEPDTRRNIYRGAHELGHAFGADHTHCIYDPAQMDFLDRCISIPNSRCYEGPVERPPDGGTVMGYCPDSAPPPVLRFHEISAEGIRRTVDSVTCVDPAQLVTLANGVPQTGLSSWRMGARGPRYFKIDVPPAVDSLRFETSGGTGNIDLYVQHGTLPLLHFFSARSRNPDNNEVIEMQAPVPAGTWYIMLRDTQASGMPGPPFRATYTGVRLTATYVEEIALQNGVTHTEVSAPAGTLLYFVIDVPVGASNLQFRTMTPAPGFGDVDLFARREEKPDLTFGPNADGFCPVGGFCPQWGARNDCTNAVMPPDFQCQPNLTHNRIIIPDGQGFPIGGRPWYITVRVKADVSNLMVTASYTP